MPLTAIDGRAAVDDPPALAVKRSSRPRAPVRRSSAPHGMARPGRGIRRQPLGARHAETANRFQVGSRRTTASRRRLISTSSTSRRAHGQISTATSAHRITPAILLGYTQPRQPGEPRVVLVYEALRSAGAIDYTSAPARAPSATASSSVRGASASPATTRRTRAAARSAGRGGRRRRGGSRR